MQPVIDACGVELKTAKHVHCFDVFKKDRAEAFRRSEALCADDERCLDHFVRRVLDPRTYQVNLKLHGAEFSYGAMPENQGKSLCIHKGSEVQCIYSQKPELGLMMEVKFRDEYVFYAEGAHSVVFMETTDPETRLLLVRQASLTVPDLMKQAILLSIPTAA